MDLRENDIWWNGVAWGQTPATLRIYLPGECRPLQLQNPSSDPQRGAAEPERDRSTVRLKVFTKQVRLVAGVSIPAASVST